ncbi:hypothetical protein D3C80_1165190 [compost metagenome]
MVQTGNFLNEGQTQTAAFQPIFTRERIKALKDAGMCVLRNSTAAIGDAQLHFFVHLPGGKLNVSPFGRKIERIIQ